MGIERGGRRRGGLAAALTGLVVLVAVAVVVFGSSSGGGGTAATPSSAPSGSALSSGSPEPTASASHSARPAPVAGQVKDGVHTGDLRFFLLPPPKGADVYGDPAGSAYSAAEMAAGSPDQGRAEQALKADGFRTGATRTYLTADGVWEVTVELARLRGPGQAAAYYGSSYYQADGIALDGGYPARGYNLASGSAESTDTLLATSYQGDVHITITLTGGKIPSRALLQKLLDSQYQRLKTGR